MQDEEIPATIFQLSENLQYISAHLDEPLDLPFLAKQCGYTAEHYSRIFKKYMGISPKQYIIRARLSQVLYLMENEHLTVMDAAYSCGFQSSSAFYKTFRQYFDASPYESLSQRGEKQE